MSITSSEKNMKTSEWMPVPSGMIEPDTLMRLLAYEQILVPGKPNTTIFIDTSSETNEIGWTAYLGKLPGSITGDIIFSVKEEKNNESSTL